VNGEGYEMAWSLMLSLGGTVLYIILYASVIGDQYARLRTCSIRVYWRPACHLVLEGHPYLDHSDPKR
jgi:hypothetical protein